jgi:hypothetical protein
MAFAKISNPLYKHHIILGRAGQRIHYIASFCNCARVTFQKTGIKPGKTRKFALTSGFSGLRYAQHTKIHSNAILSEEFSPKFARQAGETGCGRA